MSSQLQNSQPKKKSDPSVILTRTNIILFLVVVLMGAIILSQLCIVPLLLTSPRLRERIYGPPPPTPERSLPTITPAPMESDTESDTVLFFDSLPLSGYTHSQDCSLLRLLYATKQDTPPLSRSPG